MSVNKHDNATTNLPILILGKITCSIHEKQPRSRQKKEKNKNIGYIILPRNIYISYVRGIKLEKTPCILIHWWVRI